MKKLIILVISCLPLFSIGQKIDYRQGELLVRAKKDQLQSFISNLPLEQGVRIDQQVSKPMDIWLVKFDPVHANEYVLLKQLHGDSRIMEAQLNHLVYLRDTIPNDTDIDEQWQYVNDGTNGGVVDADMDIDQAWEYTTGGVTALGDTIVVCAIDDGIDTNHVDFEDNLWVNKAEIPNNGIDDDGNGYVDDYKGWNIEDSSDNISGGDHGTPVAGIIGAKGNNGIGVSGMSWNVKVMVVRNDFDTDEAAVIAAYTYPLVMRKKYNETNGAEGAFVVATNASWGINFGDPADSPLWCAFYDTLGENGIISCGATANADLNVDVDGDLPTACPSDYLISVTNLDRTDTKVGFAAYGLNHVDLGSYGEDAYTTALGNGYEGFGGTSGATPHVAGAVGLLYSIDCNDFAQTARDNPAGAAIMVKNAILASAEPNNSLDGITLTGGKLNMFNAVQWLIGTCDSNFCSVPFGLKFNAVTENSAVLEWNSLVDTTYILSYKSLQEASWTEVEVTGKSYSLTGLKPCQSYEYFVNNLCDTGRSAESAIRTFTTEGCGVCSTLDYCESFSTSSSALHIKHVELNTLNITSEDDDGYRGNIFSSTSLVQNQEYDFTIEPGYAGFNYPAYCHVYIDLNFDGRFDGEGELVYATDSTFTGSHTGKLFVQDLEQVGVTRMRVILKYQNPPFSGCEIIGFGEVEDYCVEIVDNVGRPELVTNANIDIYPNPVNDLINVSLGQDADNKNVVVRLEDVAGRLLMVKDFGTNVVGDLSIKTPKDLAEGIYFVRINVGEQSYLRKIVKE